VEQAFSATCWCKISGVGEDGECPDSFRSKSCSQAGNLTIMVSQNHQSSNQTVVPYQP
jgi:hypothetical protein